MQEALARHFGDATIAQLKSADWKARKEGMEAVVEAVGSWGSFSDGIKVGETVQGLAFLPGWAEKNFQVGLICLHCGQLGHVAYLHEVCVRAVGLMA